MKTPQPDLDSLPFLDATALYGDNEISRLYAVQIASLIVKQSPEESRGVLVGIGIVGPALNEEITRQHRTEMVEIVRLVEACQVW